jgi:hypothetical protein
MVALTGTTTTTSSEFVPLSLNWKIRVRVLTGPEGGPSRGWPTPGPKSSTAPPRQAHDHAGPIALLLQDSAALRWVALCQGRRVWVLSRNPVYIGERRVRGQGTARALME